MLLLVIFATRVVSWLRLQFITDAVQQGGYIELSISCIEECTYETIIESEIYPRISYHKAFDLYAERLTLERSGIKPGRYLLREGMSVVDIVRMLKLGLQSPVHVIFNNVRTEEQLSGVLAKQIEADSLSILRQLRAHKGAVSLFIPNTYEMWWTTTPEELVVRMERESAKFWNSEREAKRKALNMSRVEVLTLASILYEESKQEGEMARIAGVYLNRLQRGMKLQADPTVKYAMGDFEKQRVLRKDLSYDSPYNTYLYAGLPPGPICLPSIVAIDSVLNPENHNYLFFCARPEMDGYHNFATTYSAHLANARRYSAELDRMGIK